MQIRRLKRSELALTRALYEEVFSEDDEQFVDYYYKWKTRDNEIYVAEDENGIHAMVHLNPFTVVYRGRAQKLHYIVAVATQEKYRHQGLMSRLLARAEQDMKEAGEEFTFLMPASEKIYLPFGYRFFGWQRRGILNADGTTAGNAMENAAGYSGKSAADGMDQWRSNTVHWKNDGCSAGNRAYAVCRPVHPQEYDTLAQFANEVLDRQFSLYVKRDAFYYERLCAEQQCQGGDVMVIIMRIRRSGSSAAEIPGSGQQDRTAAKGMFSEKIIGVFCTAPDDQEEQGGQYRPVLREVLLDQTCFGEAHNALMNYIRPYGFCKVEGCQPELMLTQENSVPLMMGKVPGGGVLTELPVRDGVFFNEVV